MFRHLVLARIIEPVSKLDSLRVLEEAGIAPASYATLKRRLPAYAQEEWRQGLSAACAAHARLGPASLVLYDVSTLLCRPRHKSVYADLLVMPMFGCCRRSGAGEVMCLVLLGEQAEAAPDHAAAGLLGWFVAAVDEGLAERLLAAGVDAFAAGPCPPRAVERARITLDPAALQVPGHLLR